MKGSYRIRVRNRTLVYDFTIRRNLTVIRGDSATGKTTLVDMIRDYENLGADSAVSVTSDVPLAVIEGRNWKKELEDIENAIVFIDEGNRFTASEEFAASVRNSSNYFVIVAREALYNLPYSVSEIYGIKSSGKYGSFEPVYHEMFRIYEEKENADNRPDAVDLLITEDGNSGHQFFSTICSQDTECIPAEGNSNIFNLIQENEERSILIIADGAAFGPFMEKNMKLIRKNRNIHLYLPESFEWLILQSGMIDGNRVSGILHDPPQYIYSEQYFSWERYFTALLVSESKDTYLQYQKSLLNPAYLQPHEKEAIVRTLPESLQRLFSGGKDL